MRVTDFIRKRLLDQCGVVESKAGSASYEELRRTEWSPEFEKLMRNRLIMGAIRYGRLNDPSKPTYDRVGDILNRTKIYRNCGNLELLVDIANLALLEFEEGQHPNRHFRSEDDGIHTKVRI